MVRALSLVLQARALLELAKKESSVRAELLRCGALFRWLELGSSTDMIVVRYAVHALRCVSESEEHRSRLLDEPGLLQALANLTNSEDAEVTRHSLLCMMQLASETAHVRSFLQLLPAMPLTDMCKAGGGGGVEQQHACARLFYLLGRGQTAGGGYTGGGTQSMQLAESVAYPLVLLCSTAHQPQVRAQTVPRSASCGTPHESRDSSCTLLSWLCVCLCV